MRVPMSNPHPDFQRLRDTLLLQKVYDQPPAMELFCDREIMQAVLGTQDQEWQPKDYVTFQQVMGYDYLNAQPLMERQLFNRDVVPEENAESLASQRSFQDEHNGPIQNWDDFHDFQWPTVEEHNWSLFEEYSRLLPAGMQLIAWRGGFFEDVSWSMGIETLCYTLVDDRPLVKALFEKWGQVTIEVSRAAMDKPDVAAYWLSDDLGFNSGPFFSPTDLREFVFPVLSELGSMCRARDIPFILHSCGRLHDVMDDLIACGVNCLHSLPPNLYDLSAIKDRWGDKLSFAGNIDLNILGMGSAEDTRQAVRQVQEVANRGGILLSSANTVANYCKVDNYLAMMDQWWS